MRRALQLAVLGAAFAAVTVLLVPVTAAGDAANAHLRLVYLSSDSPNVDFYVDGTRVWSNVGYRTISNYSDVSAGSHSYQVRKAGAAPDSTPIGQVQQVLNADGYYSMLAAGKVDELKTAVITDAAPPNPPPDYCQARFLEASPDVPAVDVVVMQPNIIYPNISFMNASEYIRMPAGIYDIELRKTQPDHKGTVIFTVKNFNADGGHIHTLSAAGGVGRPVELVEMYDSSSASITPAGGAQTGAGGMFLRQHLPAPLALVLLPLALLGVALIVLTRRRTSLDS
ncbi:MAG: hypothetical protein DLM67_12065 [Candidatus Nephthysia bennettiae]|uniref:DUF4397 domain-containing protein n=1 Tax=Candidatus Nephthysia bennettiae TaxID=3127016 RepID=A0A934NCM4_9BACT|nr:DUF4397 domain-containing protein [Candidatus Dormibacteraeota bacterium]PZR94791.1 MAG: hypothetical protein DLM67_12065 [Candidatus Dormibacteraeota bacterium]